MKTVPLLQMPVDWEPTRATLHVYANAVGVIPRAHATPRDKWWHISLKLDDQGLATDAMPLPGGGELTIRMDLRNHEVVLASTSGETRSLSMQDGLTGAVFGERLIALVAEFGLDGEYATEKFADDDKRTYDPVAAAAYMDALVNVDHNLAVHRASLEGPTGPLQVWPHGFDLAFEWFGTRVESHEEQGETVEAPAQLNLGFYPGGRAYFYSNPWPFDASITSNPLPDPAQWHTEGWEGSILYYDELLQSPDPAARLLEYAQVVHAVAAPTLTVG